METKQIAPLLGISIQMVNKLKRRGMPCDSLESAIEWRRRNLDVTQTKNWRIDGNSGIKRRQAKVNKHLHDDECLSSTTDDDFESMSNDFNKKSEHRIVHRILTEIIPKIWFDKIGVLASITADHGVKISAESFLEIQRISFLMYLHYSDEYLQTDAVYKLPGTMLIKPGHIEYASLIEQLNKILRQPKGHATGKTHQECL